MNPDDVRGTFVPRKTPSRSNSSSSLSSNTSASSASTALTSASQPSGTSISTNSDQGQWAANSASRKRPRTQPWPPNKGDLQPDFSRLPSGRSNGMLAAQQPQQQPQQHGGPLQQNGSGLLQLTPESMMPRPLSTNQLPPGQPVLYLLSLNGTFERKTIGVPFAPDTLRIGRQTNQKTIPTAFNGFFDSKVLSRQHAEIYAERNGKIYIRDVKSSNGTFVNGTRLSQENRESEPHELQTGDHLELGIDIVSEDQKTVVHHKVAAKVEHSGFMSASNNVLDMNFGDLDPANSAMIAQPGAQPRGRQGGNAAMANNGRMAPNPQAVSAQANMPQHRPFFLSPIATDQILKRLANEMRGARLQAQDLNRTNQFVGTLLSKNDVKDLEKPEAPEAPKAHLVNGLPFRPEPKSRFSEPPAPPPQQPLPEKPSAPSLKRGITERSKSGPEASSPIRQENMSQIIQLTEALNNAKRDMDTQTARMKELETMLQKEREARELAESLARRLEDSANTHLNGSVVEPTLSMDKSVEPMADDESSVELEASTAANNEGAEAKAAAAALQERIDTMDGQMKSMQEQVAHWKGRCEAAESARDADRKSLAEMVLQLRAEEARRAADQEERRSRSRKRTADVQTSHDENAEAALASAETTDVPQSDGAVGESDAPTLSRATTITPMNASKTAPDTPLQAGLPYASALGVVLIGMGLMAYINGWQAPPPSIER
ncbi:uncharacterized protein J7T54_005188 [Emericellopsis cladophorae]|uniref:FHA domain-containing protein n=1 Tax=Emericellopsis cladophorae TaxID=2686198 RepID=A0A9P9Y1V8_9HYPO|nr:uncharacterized protein J7T54_005188 [Emericellopsis cladophorae]KAI6781977.1 hypothetical protein J7T54_005188 [Emericellopsis cladophorae]